MSIEQNKNIMKKFETMINTMDFDLANELISSEAKFTTPISPTPLVGGEGYLSVVKFMRSGFSNVQWKIEEMVAEKNIVAVNSRSPISSRGHAGCRTHKPLPQRPLR